MPDLLLVLAKRRLLSRAVACLLAGCWAVHGWGAQTAMGEASLACRPRFFNRPRLAPGDRRSLSRPIWETLRDYENADPRTVRALLKYTPTPLTNPPTPRKALPPLPPASTPLFTQKIIVGPTIENERQAAVIALIEKLRRQKKYKSAYRWTQPGKPMEERFGYSLYGTARRLHPIKKFWLDFERLVGNLERPDPPRFVAFKRETHALFVALKARIRPGQVAAVKVILDARMEQELIAFRKRLTVKQRNQLDQLIGKKVDGGT